MHVFLAAVVNIFELDKTATYFNEFRTLANLPKVLLVQIFQNYCKSSQKLD